MKTKLLVLIPYLCVVMLLLSCASNQARPEVVSMDVERFPAGSATLIENKNKDFWLIRDSKEVLAISSRSTSPIAQNGDTCRARFFGVWDGQKWLPDDNFPKTIRRDYFLLMGNPGMGSLSHIATGMYGILMGKE